MGLVQYVSRKTGDEVQADFPLHPELIKATRADGSEFQIFRREWDAEYFQQLPELPKIDVNAIPLQPEPSAGDQLPAEQPYAAPSLVKLSSPSPLPASHSAWFVVIFDRLGKLGNQIDQLIAAVQEAQTEPTPAPAPAEQPAAPPASDQTQPG